jgi:hypothetical protein
MQPRYTKATTAGHPEGTKPKPGVDIRAANVGKGNKMCEIIKTKTGQYVNQRDKGCKGEKGEGR